MMVVCDCENELFRDNTRGLEGGAFFVATLLNRKEAKTSKGKNAIDSLKDFFLLKSDARFTQYFMAKFSFNPLVDNTPPLIKTKTSKLKVSYLHSLVSECLRDLLPFFRESKISDDTATLLLDHPLQLGRKDSRKKSPPTQPPVPVPETLEMTSLVTQELAEAAAEVINDVSKDDFIAQFVETKTVEVSATRSNLVYSCKLCLSHESKYRSVCMAHIEACLRSAGVSGDGDNSGDDDPPSESGDTDVLSEQSDSSTNSDSSSPSEQKDDFFFNYKNGEFFLDSLCMISSVYERYGDGLGCYIVSKILLPIFHGLHHSNYTCSIHRFISRVLAEASPKEALRIIHERFSNRAGRSGKNVHRDRRMEFRIGITKKLIENLGPNFSDLSVKQVNQTVDVKEELYIQTRLSHGVRIRSGRHVPRSDEHDFDTLVKHLTDLDAHSKTQGRQFGDIKLPENIMDDKRFDKTQFYRWIASKNEEAKDILEAKKRVN